ncbi:MAG: 50S ribosomal protein L3 N(5)-glutamine methyltransferase [Gammaproteobacteria bacterium]|nr:50S ribosomal protein L3 N(5)-glutamine methyltransferase [Gammaproteobacteria bacterium]
MTRTLRELVDECESALTAADLYFGHGTDNAFDEAAWLAAHVAGIDLASADDLPWQRPVTAEEAAAARRLVDERIRSPPTARLPDQRSLVRRRAVPRRRAGHRAPVPPRSLGSSIDSFPWIDPQAVRNILDLCTGSGCIAVALALNFPEARVTATDISADALEVARRNVDEHGVGARVRLLAGDGFLPVAGEVFDLVVCNPPYVADRIMDELPVEYRHEPSLAFRGGAEGLDFIRRLLAEAPGHLAEGGVLVVEAGSAGEALEAAYPRVPFTRLETDDGGRSVFLMTREELLEFL